MQFFEEFGEETHDYVKKDALFYFVLFTISTGKSISSTISNINII